MKIINEDIANLERCIENDRVDAVGSMPITMADAFYQSQKNEEDLEKQEKDTVKVPEPEKVIGAEKQPVPRMPEEPKLTLEESLFEDYSLENFIDKLSNSMLDLQENFYDVSIMVSSTDFDPDWDDEFSKGYPFDKSFDELAFEVADWVDRFTYFLSKQKVNESLEEAKRGPKASALVDSQGNVYTDDDRSTPDIDDSTNNLWTVVYNEIAPEHINWMTRTRFKDIPPKSRYDENKVNVNYDDNLEIVVSSEDELDFAKRVADEYGLELMPPRPYRKNDSRLVATLIMPEA